MTIKFRAFPSIGQYANIVKQVRDSAKWNNVPVPTLTFTGSCKLHGTNAALVFTKDDEIGFQSRERMLSYESDNAGFAAWGLGKVEALKFGYREIASMLPGYDACYVYGEWCGGSIQKGVALNQLDKRFAIFQIVLVNYKTDAEMEAEKQELIAKDNESPVYPFKAEKIVESIVDLHDLFNGLSSDIVVVNSVVSPKKIEIDFNRPELKQNELLELTLAVENLCPFGKAFGVEGIGEGLVWTCDTIPTLKFKTKGSAHSSSKVKTVKELTEAEISSKANAIEFVDFACSENRLEQGISKLKEMGLPVDNTSMGAYLKWLGNDILSECTETLVKSGIERKDVMPQIANKGRNWFLAYVNKEAGL
jgi:hypothetical protein